MDIIFEVVDPLGKKVHLSSERWKHIQKHPYMHEHLENIKLTLKKPVAINYENDENVLYFYKEFKQNEPRKRYLLV